MVSIDTDKLIRDKADNLAKALLKHVEIYARGANHPGLRQVEVLDLVIAHLKEERRAIVNGWREPTKSSVVRATTDGKTIDFPLREMDHSDVAGLPTVGRSTPADVHRIVGRIRMNRGRK